MTPGPEQRHIEAARREVRVRSWDATATEAAWHALQERRHRSESRRRLVTAIGGTLVVAAVLALAFGAFLGSASEGDIVTAVAPRESTDTERITFDDGTEVRFDEGVRVDVVERSAERVVVKMTDGMARFVVRHDPHRIFRVVSGDVIVDDIGTVFSVEGNDALTKVSVSEGEVAVSFVVQGERQRVTLGAGNSRAFIHETNQAPASAPAPGATAEADAGAPATPPAHGRSSTPAAPQADWRTLARAGKYRDAYALLAPGGFGQVRDEPGDLVLASDVARHSQHPAESVRLLRRVLAHHQEDPRARSAAFTLGWLLMTQLGQPRQAAVAFDRVRSLAPGGNLAEDALARSVEAWYRAGERARAEDRARTYRESYPNGRHSAMLARLLGKK